MLYPLGMLKSDAIAKLLSSRLEQGEYVHQELPSEERLSLELEVSRKTIRRALQSLEAAGLLRRLDNGRLGPVPQFSESALPQVLVLQPAWQGAGPSQVVMAMHQAAAAEGVGLRPRHYVHWEDPTLTKTLASVAVADHSDGYCGLVIIPPAETVSPLIHRQILDTKARLVVVGRDLSPQGVVSLLPVPPSATATVLEHLLTASDGPIDCFNSQPLDEAIAERLRVFREQLTGTGRAGMVINDPATSYQDPVAQARRLGERYLSDLDLSTPRSVLCLTEAAAIGLVRAAHNHGVSIGDQLRIAAVDDAGLCQYLTPTITSIKPRTLLPDFARCFTWMKHRTAWRGSHLLSAKQAELFVGESSGAAASTIRPDSASPVMTKRPPVQSGSAASTSPSKDSTCSAQKNLLPLSRS